MTVRTADPDPEDARAVVDAANVLIESEAANVMIEIEFTKAARVGSMLNVWRTLMSDGGFTDEWVEKAAYAIFQTFFPPPPRVQVERVICEDDDE